MTKKKRKPVKSIEKLSDDLRGQRALKGESSVLAVPVYSIDRWITKADSLEQSRDRLIKHVLEIGSYRKGREAGDVHRDLDELQKRLKNV